MKKVLLFIITIALFTNCTTPKMALQDGWQTKEEYAVNGKRKIFAKESMSFGDYRTTEVKRSWIKGSTSRIGIAKGNVTDPYYENIISSESVKKKQTVRFKMEDSKQNQSEVYCISKFKSKQLLIGKNENSILNIATDIFGIGSSSESSYYVQLYTNKSNQPWEMLIDNQAAQEKAKTYIGYLSLNRDTYYTITPVYKMEDKNGVARNLPFGSIGFEIKNKQGEPVAAISKLDKGMVYFQNISNEEKFLLANACTALLLQDLIE
jgi:hypothetical protein